MSSLNVKVPRLGKNRHGVYYVRSSEPDQEGGKRKVRQRSLATKDPQVARLLALKFCLALIEEQAVTDPRDLIGRYELDLPGGKAKSNGPADHARMLEAMKAMQAVMEAQARMSAAQPPTGFQSQSAPTVLANPPSARKPAADARLRQALNAHLAEEGQRMRSTHTVGEKQVLYDEFVDLFGDIELNQVTAIDITARWRPTEFKRPNKKYKGKTLSLARLEKRRGYLLKFFSWAILGGLYHHANPMALKMASKKEVAAQQTPYAEFTEDDLAKLFASSFAMGMYKPDWYWLPLMSLFSGARLGELANLELARFEEIEGIKTYRIDKLEEADRADGAGADAGVKNVPSQRTVPIHSSLLELGLWDYVQHLIQRGESHLIPHRSANGRGKSAGREWGVWVKKCGITDKSKVFHSFRSTAITDLHNADAGHAAIRRTTGHAAAGTTGSHGTYIRGIRLRKLRDTVEMLNFPTVNLSGLRLADPTFSAFFAAEEECAKRPKVLEAKERRERNAIAKAKRLALAKTRRPRTTKPLPGT
jgi:integrase